MAQANQADLLGEGLYDPKAVKAAAPGVTPQQQRADAAAPVYEQLQAEAAQTGTGNLLNYDRSQGTGAPLGGQQPGATGAYDIATPSGKATYDYMHSLGSGTGVNDVLNRVGESAGMTHVGDVMDPLGQFAPKNPLTFNPVAKAADPNTGLGTTLVNTPGGSSAGRPITNMTPGTAAAGQLAGQGVLQTAGNAVKNAFDFGGGAGGRGSGLYDENYLTRALGNADSARQLGASVMSGAQNAPDAGDKARQAEVFNQAMKFATAPTDEPTKADLLLKQAQEQGMSDALSVARSGRARDAGSQARALQTATAENAASSVANARDAAALRQQEAKDFRDQQLQGLTLGGNVATGIRSGTDTERGQTLNFGLGTQQVGAQTEGDVLKTIPQLEQARHADQFELTPSQKLKLALMGAGGDVLSSFL
jgi:hypothetical protein